MAGQNLLSAILVMFLMVLVGCGGGSAPVEVAPEPEPLSAEELAKLQEEKRMEQLQDNYTKILAAIRNYPAFWTGGWRGVKKRAWISKGCFTLV